MQLYGVIEEIKYKPFLCNNLKEYGLEEFNKAISESSNFILKIDEKKQNSNK